MSSVFKIFKNLVNENLLITAVPAATAALGKYVGIENARQVSEKALENSIKKDFATEYLPTNLIPISFGARSIYDTYKNWCYLTAREKMTIATLLFVGVSSTVYALVKSSHEQTLMTQGSFSSFGALLFKTASAVATYKNNLPVDQTNYQKISESPKV